MAENKEKVLVTGAGGFIGHHLVTSLKEKGYWVRGIDVKYPEYTPIDADDFIKGDLKELSVAKEAVTGMGTVYHLAADMGGMGYIQSNHGVIYRSSNRIDTNVIDSAEDVGVKRFFYSSSACVYNEDMQEDVDVTALKEDDAIPAKPQDAYGWQKLNTEMMLLYRSGDFKYAARLARFHNIFGPYGTWTGGREKAPASMCRKAAVAKLTGDYVIDVWGDGEQTRSFCFVDDCVDGIQKLMMSEYPGPLNIGSDRLISINNLALMAASVADIDVNINHIEGNQGVRGRNSDNTRLKEVLKWEPQTSLEEGMRKTYVWIEENVKAALEKGIDPQDLKSGAYLRKTV